MEPVPVLDIRELSLDDLTVDQKLFLRDRIDDFTVERYAEAWLRLPPITVFEVKGRFLVADGFHRHAAAVLLGKKKLRAEVRKGTFNDALDFVASVNLYHGLPLTRAERRRAVEVKLKLHHDWSDRRMAEELGVSRELVAKTRRALIESGQVPDNPARVGADGKVYTSAGVPRPPREHPPKGKAAEEREEPRERGGRAEPTEPGRARGPAPAPPWDSKAAALAEPVPAAAPTIDEMLEIMAKQVIEVVNWTQAEGFIDAYRTASANARGLFQAAVIKLAARADQLRKS